MPTLDTRLFPTTVVGSMPRPLLLKELFDEFHAGHVSEAERDRCSTRPYRSRIALQEAAGVDIISDGEWRRFSYVGVITDVATRLSARLVRRRADGKYWHTVTGAVETKSDRRRWPLTRASRSARVATDQGRAAEPISA